MKLRFEILFLNIFINIPKTAPLKKIHVLLLFKFFYSKCQVETILDGQFRVPFNYSQSARWRISSSVVLYRIGVSRSIQDRSVSLTSPNPPNLEIVLGLKEKKTHQRNGQGNREEEMHGGRMEVHPRLQTALRPLPDRFPSPLHLRSRHFCLPGHSPSLIPSSFFFSHAFSFFDNLNARVSLHPRRLIPDQSCLSLASDRFFTISPKTNWGCQEGFQLSLLLAFQSHPQVSLRAVNQLVLLGRVSIKFFIGHLTSRA